MNPLVVPTVEHSTAYFQRWQCRLKLSHSGIGDPSMDEIAFIQVGQAGVSVAMDQQPS